MDLAWASSLGWLPVWPVVLLCRLNSAGHLVGWIITHCLGKDCLPLLEGLLSELDCIRWWASDSPLRLPFWSPPAKSLPTLAECALQPNMKRLGVHGLRVVSFRERCCVPSATLLQH